VPPDNNWEGGTLPGCPQVQDADALARVASTLRQAGAGLVVMDCMGFNRKTRDEVRALTGAPVLLANLLVARVIAELCGA
jgi:protein AroM